MPQLVVVCPGAEPTLICGNLSPPLEAHFVKSPKSFILSVCKLLDLLIDNDASKRTEEFKVQRTSGLPDHELICVVCLPRQIKITSLSDSNLKHVTATFVSRICSSFDFLQFAHQCLRSCIINAHCRRDTSSWPANGINKRWLSPEEVAAKCRRRQPRWRSSNKDDDYRPSCRTKNMAIDHHSVEEWLLKTTYQFCRYKSTRTLDCVSGHHISQNNATRHRILCDLFAYYFNPKIINIITIWAILLMKCQLNHPRSTETYPTLWQDCHHIYILSVVSFLKMHKSCELSTQKHYHGIKFNSVLLIIFDYKSLLFMQSIIDSTDRVFHYTFPSKCDSAVKWNDNELYQVLLQLALKLITKYWFISRLKAITWFFTPMSLALLLSIISTRSRFKLQHQIWLTSLEHLFCRETMIMILKRIFLAGPHNENFQGFIQAMHECYMRKCFAMFALASLYHILT